MKINKQSIYEFLDIHNKYYKMSEDINNRITEILSLIYEIQIFDAMWSYKSALLTDENNDDEEVVNKGFFDPIYAINNGKVEILFDYSWLFSCLHKPKFKKDVYERISLGYNFIPIKWFWESDESILSEYNAVKNKVVETIKLERQEKEKQVLIRIQEEEDRKKRQKLIYESISSKLTEEEKKFLKLNKK